MKSILIFSTRATDYITRVDLNTPIVRRGGPAQFIEDTMIDLGARYELVEAPAMKVEIEVKGGRERGAICGTPNSKPIVPKRRGLGILVSTLLNEWELTTSDSPIFVDIQGYARNNRQSKNSSLIKWADDEEASIMAAKGTEAEVGQLEKNLFERLKQKQLIITRGIEGATLFDRGRKFEVRGRRVINPADTVGAGDTWFSAYMVYQLVGGLSPLTAAEEASEYVSNFLERKPGYERS